MDQIRPCGRKFSPRLVPEMVQTPLMVAAVQYLTNETGEKTGVVLSMADYERLMDDLQDLADLVARRDEPTIPHEEFLAQLKADGLIPN